MSEQGKPRRPKGTGTLRHLGGDRWRVWVNVGGRRLSRVFTARNATEANRAADAVRLDLMREHKQTADAQGAERKQRQAWTVERYFDYYFEQHGPELAVTTQRRYRTIADHQIIPHIGKLRMAEVTVADLNAMYRALAGKGSRQRGGDGALSGPTIWTTRAVASALFTFACDQEDMLQNPARKSKPKVSSEGRDKKALTVAEVERFVALADAKAPLISVPVMLCAYLGTRRSETLALRWCDVDLDAAEVAVRRSVTQTPKDGVIVRDSTKTHKNRVIPLDAHTITRLRAVQTEQRKARLRLGQAWEGADAATEDYVCATPTGALITPDTFATVFRTVARQNGMGNVTPHLLRHAFVSQMIALGFDAVTIAAMTGHSADVLLRVYAHAFDGRKQEAVDRLGEAREIARQAAASDALLPKVAAR